LNITEVEDFIVNYFKDKENIANEDEEDEEEKPIPIAII
jgi:hypothetical protein